MPCCERFKYESLSDTNTKRVDEYDAACIAVCSPLANLSLICQSNRQANKQKTHAHLPLPIQKHVHNKMTSSIEDVFKMETNRLMSEHKPLYRGKITTNYKHIHIQ